MTTDSGSAHTWWPGLLALAFYVTHAGHHTLRGTWEESLWGCHMASLLIAVGWLRGSAMWNGMGVAWLTYGFPMWVVYLALGNELMLTSILTHVGSFGLGLWGARRMGMPHGVAWRAFALSLGVSLLTRLITPPQTNVNMVFRIMDGFEEVYPNFGAFLASVFGGLATTCLMAEIGWRRVFGKPRDLAGRLGPTHDGRIEREAG